MAEKESGKMNTEEQKFGTRSEIGILRGIAAAAICVFLAPTPGLARQMMCSYDFITHLTVLKLDDLDAAESPISYSFAHFTSPTGGEDLFPFSESDPADLRGTGRLEFIVEKLFFNPLETPSAIEFVDFDRPALKQLQFPASYLEHSVDTISAPLVVWDCYRTD
jgi:hypothetical protein